MMLGKKVREYGYQWQFCNCCGKEGCEPRNHIGEIQRHPGLPKPEGKPQPLEAQPESSRDE